MSIMKRLKRETAEQHRATERRPLVKAMLQGHLAPDAFQWKLWGYRELHRLVWRWLEGDEGALGADLVAMTRPREAHLDADLDVMVTPIPLALRRWRDGLEARRPHDPAAALGWLYVLEGSALGAQVLIKPLTKRYPGTLLHYYRGHGEATRAHWTAFSSHMDELLAEENDDCVDGARDCFEAVADLFDAIDGARRHPRTHYPPRAVSLGVG